MTKEIRIPSMGESVTQATVTHFLKPEGAEVKENEEIVELETEKVNQVLYAPSDGVVHWSAKEGDVTTIGQVIGTIEEKVISKEKPSPPTAEEKELKKEKEVIAPQTEEKKILPSKKEKEPLQEKILSSKKEKQEDKEVTRKTMSSLRKTIAERLVSVLKETAMLTTFNEVDMTTVIELRNRHKDTFLTKKGIKLGFMSFFVKATIDALKLYPDLNSFIEGDEIVTPHSIHMGIALSTERGLVVPVLKQAEKLSFADIEKGIDQFAKKAKEGRMSVDDLRGGTFTITNGGVFGSLLSTPLLNPPQSGILGMHKIEKRPVVINDKVEIRSMMYLALSYDHRIVDGKEAVGFLVRIKQVLEDPSLLLLESEI